MTPTIGIDLVETERFKRWHTYSDRQLRKLFSAAEITYCRAIPAKSAERFAVRFAAREALFKALSPYTNLTGPNSAPPLLTLFACTEIRTDSNGVRFHIDWDLLKEYYPIKKTTNITIQTSFSHTSTTACAVVMTHSFT